MAEVTPAEIKFAEFMGWPIERSQEVLKKYEEILDNVLDETHNMTDGEWYAYRDKLRDEYENARKVLEGVPVR